jgi:chemotaxis protein methyltransferase CheR
MQPHGSDLLTPEQFALLREAIERTSGIVLGAGKLSHLDSVVRERMHAVGDRVVADYLVRATAGAPHDAERKALVTALLVGETSFFRTPALYDVLRRKLMGGIAGDGRALPMRIWSAGCATGEEPYSLAITALQAFEGRHEPVRILATDLHPGFLEVAREGIYPDFALRDAPEQIVRKYFRELPDGRFRVTDEVRRLVTFEQRNLAEMPTQAAAAERYSLILCRNVMIYFRSETTRKVVARFHDRLDEGGLFFLGHSETLWGISEAFRLEECDGVFFYRKRDPADPSPSHASAGSRSRGRAVAQAAAASGGARRSAPIPPPVAASGLPPVAASRPPSRETAPPHAPPDAPPPAAPNAAALDAVRRAEKLMDADRVAEAEAACREALTADPGCVEAEYLLAVLLRREGRCDEARIHAARALVAEPRFVLAALEMAECLAIRGRRDDAREQWRSVAAMLEGDVLLPRLSPATGLSPAALRDYVAVRLK